MTEKPPHQFDFNLFGGTLLVLLFGVIILLAVFGLVMLAVLVLT